MKKEPRFYFNSTKRITNFSYKTLSYPYPVREMILYRLMTLTFNTTKIINYKELSSINYNPLPSEGDEGYKSYPNSNSSIQQSSIPIHYPAREMTAISYGSDNVCS